MDKSLKVRSVTRSSPRSSHKVELEESDTEKMDVCDASFNGNTTSDMNKTKTSDVILVLSDDEDFAGFGVCNNGKSFLL